MGDWARGKMIYIKILVVCRKEVEKDEVKETHQSRRSRLSRQKSEGTTEQREEGRRNVSNADASIQAGT